MRKRGDQLAFALFDPVYRDLRSRRLVTAISFGFGFEKKIQASEITHEALTNSRINVRIRSPAAPTEVQIGFQVIAPHTTSVNNVEMAILPIRSRYED